MPDRAALFAVTHREDVGPVGPHIPTLGYPTSAADAYRIAGIVENGHKGWNSCYTDVATCAALARLVEGGLRSIDDIRAAEVALQILLWHDRVDVLVPAFKFRLGSMSSYARADEPRSQMAFDLFAPCIPYDQIFAVECVDVEDNQVVRSNLAESSLVGRSLADAKTEYLAMSKAQAAVLAAMPIHMGVPAYFTDPYITPFTGKRGFFGKFYGTMARQWEQTLDVVPDIDSAIPMPPMISIVLDRSADRAGIPEAIAGLRAELSAVRTEMLGLSDMVQGALSQKEIEQKCREVQQSFEAALPASRRPPVSLLLPILKAYRAVRSPLDELIKVLNPNFVPGDPRLLANRTVTGRLFSRLLATDSMHSMATHFFYPDEIAAIEHSLSTPDRDA
jgi:hypothetical protein